jgi:hypothetical protein
MELVHHFLSSPPPTSNQPPPAPALLSPERVASLCRACAPSHTAYGDTRTRTRAQAAQYPAPV